VLRALAGAGAALALLAGAGGEEAAAHNPKARCRTIEDPQKRKTCLQQAKRHARTHRTTTPPPGTTPAGTTTGRPGTTPRGTTTDAPSTTRTPTTTTTTPRRPNAACVAPTTGTISPAAGPFRFAQTFTEPNGGRLRAAELYFRQDPGGTGTFLLQVTTVDPDSGVPTNNAIATAELRAADFGAGYVDFFVFGFTEPPTLVAGRRYALVLSKPDGTGRYYVHVATPNPCFGGEAFESTTQTGPFRRIDEGGFGSPPQASAIPYRTTVSA
jgi:hypothetical protein